MGLKNLKKKNVTVDIRIKAWMDSLEFLLYCVKSEYFSFCITFHFYLLCIYEVATPARALLSWAGKDGGTLVDFSSVRSGPHITTILLTSETLLC